MLLLIPLQHILLLDEAQMALILDYTLETEDRNDVDERSDECQLLKPIAQQ